MDHTEFLENYSRIKLVLASTLRAAQPSSFLTAYETQKLALSGVLLLEQGDLIFALVIGLYQWQAVFTYS